MQELNDNEMQEISGGSWGSQKKIDFSKMVKTNHYFYPKASVTLTGNTIKLKKGASRTLLTKQLGTKTITVGTAQYNYVNSKGTQKQMIHVKLGGFGEGYINAAFTRLIK